MCIRDIGHNLLCMYMSHLSVKYPKTKFWENENDFILLTVHKLWSVTKSVKTFQWVAGFSKTLEESKSSVDIICKIYLPVSNVLTVYTKATNIFSILFFYFSWHNLYFFHKCHDSPTRGAAHWSYKYLRTYFFAY